ncbi:MAG: type II toxin-antitoxin system VapC family toxin [Burkholderiales bacterium]
MTGLDTNVLVRYIMQDDAKQAKLATKLVESLNDESPGFVSLVSIVELSWVLETAFNLSRSQLVEVFKSFMAVDAFKLERASVVAGAVRAYGEGKADFADYLIERSSAQAGCKRTMTFDKEAAKTGGMVLIQ